jgi:hypothetical protein
MGFGYKFTIATSRNACLINECNTQSVLMENTQRYRLSFIRKYQNPGGQAHQGQLRIY